MNTYNPCPLEYNTFMKYSQMPKQKGFCKSKQAQNVGKKENMPGPGAYQVINTWIGKEPLKKDELSFLNGISKGPSINIYNE